MKDVPIILCSDLHESYRFLDELMNLCRKRGCFSIAFAGDYLNMGETIGFARQLTNCFKENNIDLFWVPGNNDFGPGYHVLNSQYRSLEGRVALSGEIKFSGVGGSPASWAGQYNGEKMIGEADIANSIFISHVPPPGLLSYKKTDSSSPTSRKFSNSPLIHICGHIHSQWGCAYLGQTKVIKLAPLLYGYYALLDPKSLQVEFCRFNATRVII